MSLKRDRRYSDSTAQAQALQEKATRAVDVCSAGPSLKERFSTPNGFNLSVNLSDITDEDVHVIVNCNDENLTGFSSGLPKRIIDKGGKSISEKLEAQIKRKERTIGEVLVTKSGKLYCQMIMHAIMSTDHDTEGVPGQVVKDATLKCLKIAHSRNMKSIAFPLVGIGIRDVESTSKDMLDAFGEYMTTSETPKVDRHVVTDVRFVFSDETEYSVFRSELKSRYGDFMVRPSEHPTSHTSDHDREMLERQLRDMKKVNEELKTQLDNERQENERLEALLTEGSQRVEVELVAGALEDKHEAEQEKATTSKALHLLEEQNARKDLERQLQKSKERADELQQRCNEQARESCDWILNRDEVVLFSDKVIGRGAYGEVYEGTFRRTRVAVKRLHQITLSQRNKGRFEREMNMASRCRHPCLLQFIGATADDSLAPLLVTELMETSLRELLRKCELQLEEVSTIALDISRGLNYLHLNRPDPIVHRDISSGNALLWRQNGSWRAKLSDYGTANFIQLCVTLRPGADAYCAPEAANQFQQPTTKIDVYSFGVLLLEMSIPEPLDKTRRHEQIAMVTNPHHRELIKSCSDHDPEKRPSMAEIIDILERAGETLRMPIIETS